MQTVTISLSTVKKKFLEDQAVRNGFSSISEYVEALVHAEHQRQAKRKLGQMVKEAEGSGQATAMTSKDWEALKAKVWGRESRSKEPGRGKSSQKASRRAGSR